MTSSVSTVAETDSTTHSGSAGATGPAADPVRPKPPAAGNPPVPPSRGSGRARIRLLQLAVFSAFIALWWAITRFSSVDPVVLPSPGAVLEQLINSNRCVPMDGNPSRLECGVQGYFLWQHLLATLQRLAVGLGAGILAGIMLGWMLAANAMVRAIVEPYLSFLRALPPLGYIGLLIVWFGIGDESKVVLLFLTSFPVVAVSTLAGVIGVRQDWILAARTLGASRSQVFRAVIIPGALPEVINGIRLASAMTWASIVAAEMNDGIPGIGGLAYISGTQLNTALTIASIIVIGLAALLMDQFLLTVERHRAPWRGKQ